ncbi:MAG: heavy metal-associated domain-containing protein [Propionibacteriaceae bacterium]|nr:heavy metal-associated domain-containing protein [Propionibacteriaceae bacterium]
MPATTTHTLLRSEGFSCPSCVSKIEKRLSNISGVRDVKVHFTTARIEIDHDPAVSVESLVDEVKKAGFTARPAAF